MEGAMLRGFLLWLGILVIGGLIAANLPPLPTTEEAMICTADSVLLSLSGKVTTYVKCPNSKYAYYVDLKESEAFVKPGSRLDCLQIHEFLPVIGFEIPKDTLPIKSCTVIRFN